MTILLNEKLTRHDFKGWENVGLFSICSLEQIGEYDLIKFSGTPEDLVMASGFYSPCYSGGGGSGVSCTPQEAKTLDLGHFLGDLFCKYELNVNHGLWVASSLKRAERLKQEVIVGGEFGYLWNKKSKDVFNVNYLEIPNI